MANCMAKFLPHMHLADIAAPLWQLTAKNTLWAWQYQQQEAFEKIRELIAKSTTLQFYDIVKPVTIQCNANEYGLGATIEDTLGN